VTAERKFLLPWLASAVVITFIRLLHASDLGYDPALQIQAGQNLLAGKGLAIYWPTSQDLAAPLTLEVLTHYSAGYSLYAAALMAIGVGEGALVKILGAFATIVGWWGWARLAFAFMGGDRGRGRLWRFTGYWVAVVTPLLFTSRWAGTDIVLWAATPWVLALITRAPDSRAQADSRSDVLAGLLIGVCVLARYASVFLVVYAVLLVVGQSRFRPAVVVKRLAALGAGLLPGVAVQAYINFVVAPDGTAPGGVTVSPYRAAIAAARAWESVTTLASANHGLFFWLPTSFRVWTDVRYEPPALALAAVALIGLPLILISTRRESISAWYHDSRVVGAGMLVALPVFLWTCGLFGTYVYIRDVRYYAPLRPLAVCVAYFLATIDVAGVGRRLAAVAWLSRAYLCAFVVMTAVEIASVLVPTPRGDVWRRALLGAEPRPWPSSRLTYESSPARAFVLGLMKDQPRARLITTREQWFYAEREADRSRIMRWEPCDSLRATHISGPARFFIFEADRDLPPRVRWPDQWRRGRECWPKLPGVQFVRRFPDERLRVLQADIPEGMRIEIERLTPAE